MQHPCANDTLKDLPPGAPGTRELPAWSATATWAERRRTGRTRNKTILVADDDADVLALVSTNLQRAGYEVLTAESGDEALRMAEQHAPALFLLDIKMPGTDGFAVCQRLKANARLAESPVVFLTGRSDPEGIVRGFEIGGVDYVRKPVIISELLARVRTHIELALTRQALRRRADLFESIMMEQGRDLDDVRTGQELLLTNPNTFPSLNIAVHFQPAHAAGGDFYEIAALAGDEYALLVADVAGHDLSTPFVTGALKALAASFVDATLRPADTLRLFNASLARFLAPGRFISACYARYAPAQQRIEIANAGHPYPVFHPRGGEPHAVELVGDLLGIFRQTHFDVRVLEVKPGDRLFLFTDGVTESFPGAKGRRGQALGGAVQLCTRIKACADLTLDRAVHAVVDDLLEQNGGSLDDDLLLLGLEV